MRKFIGIRHFLSGFVFLVLTLGTVISSATALYEPELSISKKIKSIRETERLLNNRGYWITKVDNIRDSSTYHAIVAFQKVEGRRRSGRLSGPLIKAIRKSRRPKPTYIGAPHIEIDLAQQVLFLVDAKDKVTHILPVSTGSGKTYYQNGKKHVSRTPRGIFKITRQIKGKRYAPLGVLYHPNYFYRGVAIHGSDSIPFYPASHGCVRIPRFASKKFSDLLSVGMHVIVYEKAGKQKTIIDKEVNEKPLPIFPIAYVGDHGC